MPIQLRCFNNIWPFFTKVAPLLVWFLHPWLSTTNGFYRNYQELGGGKMGGQKIIWGGAFAPPPRRRHCGDELLTCTCFFSKRLANLRAVCPPHGEYEKIWTKPSSQQITSANMKKELYPT